MKPTVHYTPTSVDIIKVGHSAFVVPVDHPSDLVSNTTFVKTSPVVKLTDTGFETQNTIYQRKVN